MTSQASIVTANAWRVRLPVDPPRGDGDALVENGILPPRPDVLPARHVAAAALIAIGVALGVSARDREDRIAQSR